ncbi:P-loop containing nucleoside triphosphate hydrolase protein [Lactarius hatsudake]|nr:P-loop containing nucleoside triphosphate hydrolase protein [Lactarius hatsudake]
MSPELSTSSPHDVFDNAPEQVQASAKTRVILVGIGGATCSGKTTLAKHLRNIIPDSFIIHQDVPPKQTLPIHPTFGQDWDSAPTAIAWPRLREFLRTKPVQLGESLAARCKEEISRMQKEVEAASGVRVVWGIVDGFLLYWDPEVVDTLDARIFIRVPYDILKERRSVRSGYATAEQMSSEGSFWKDPPGYFENLVYPRARRLLPGLVIIEASQLSMDDVVSRCCEELVTALRRYVDTRTGEA